MILEEIKNIDSRPKKIREFAFVVGGVLCVFGVFSWWRGRDFFPWILSPGIFLVAAGIVSPMVMKPLQKAWMTLAILMGWVMGRVLLSILFYLVLTPIGLVLRLMGKDLLDLKRDTSIKSYWNIRSQSPHMPADPEKQF